MMTNKRCSLAALLLACSALASAESVPYRYNGQIHFDVKHVPFSRFGSYLSISDLTNFQLPLRRSGLYLRTMHEGGRNAFRLQLTRGGVTIPFTVSATPTLLTLSGESAFVEISFQGPDRLRIRGHGAGLELTAEVADGPQSVIMDEVHNGVPTRMAILARALGKAK